MIPDNTCCKAYLPPFQSYRCMYFSSLHPILKHGFWLSEGLTFFSAKVYLLAMTMLCCIQATSFSASTNSLLCLLVKKTRKNTSRKCCVFESEALLSKMQIGGKVMAQQSESCALLYLCCLRMTQGGMICNCFPCFQIIDINRSLTIWIYPCATHVQWRGGIYSWVENHDSKLLC